MKVRFLAAAERLFLARSRRNHTWSRTKRYEVANGRIGEFQTFRPDTKMAKAREVLNSGDPWRVDHKQPPVGRRLVTPALP